MSTLDLLRVVNTGDKPLILRHDGKGDVTIEPGRHRILPAEYAYLSFGHPAAVNAGKDKSRDVEYKNCQTTWGFYSGVMPEAAWTERVISPLDGLEYGPFKPDYECYDMDDNRVLLVADDPDGTMTAVTTGVPTEDQSDRIERNAMAAQLAAQQRQIEELRNLVLTQHHTAVPADLGGFDDDTPDEPDDDDDDDFEDDEPSVIEKAAAAASTPAKRGASTKKAAGKETQAARNEKRDSIPKPPADEPPVGKDNPRATRVGGR